jgi:DNA topoisomerase VI subunit A
MKRYDNIVLNKLLDSYENSSAYRAERYGSGESAVRDSGVSEMPKSVAETGCAEPARDSVKTAPARRRGIFCRIDKKNFPDYFDEASGAYDVLHQQFYVLEQKGLIRLYWRDGIEGHILEKAALNTENIPEAYRYLSRLPLWKKEERIKDICSSYLCKDNSCSANTDAEAGTDILLNFLSWVTVRIDAGESIRQFADVDDPAGFDRLCRLVAAIINNDRDIYLRQFSTAVFNDSKTAEKILDKAASVIRNFGGGTFGKDADSQAENLSTDEILENYGIYRNPLWIYMKGHAGIIIGDSSVDLSVPDNGIGLTLRDLDFVRADPESAPDCVLTVENLTSYYQQETIVEGKKAMVIYIGGFAGRKKRNFIKDLSISYPSAEFMHSGDIDCGGFRIWKSLCEGCGIRFKTYRMDCKTFMRYRSSGRPMTAHDIRTLEAMRSDPFYADQRELFEMMLDAGLKLEQESFAE